MVLTFKCINCSWEGNKGEGLLNHCPNCGDNLIDITAPQIEENIQVNNEEIKPIKSKLSKRK